MGRGATNERPGTDHVISGPMRGLEKNPAADGTDRQTHTHSDRHGDSMTESEKHKTRGKRQRKPLS